MNQDLTTGNPRNVLWKFCIPLFGSIIFQQLYNIADSMIAGKFIGELALAAVGNSYGITLVFIAFGFGSNIGVSVVVARLFGSKQYEMLKTAVSTAFLAGACLVACLMVLGFVSCDWLLQVTNTPADTFADSKTYLNIYILGVPFLYFYNVATGIFSALGDSKTPFYFLAASSIANIVMDVLFVVVFRMGVPGVAYATLICQGISCILAVFVIWRRLQKIETKWKPKWFSKSLLKSIAAIAIPSILQQGCISVGNIILQGVINNFGTGVMAGYSAGVKLNNLVITSFTTIGNGISSFTAQNIGAGKMDRVRAGFKEGVRLIGTICIPITLLYVILAEPLIRLFIHEPTQTAMHTGMIFLRMLSPFYLVISVKLIADGVLRGAGKMNQFMMATFTDLILRVGLSFVFSATSLGSTGIWMSWPVGWSIALVMSYGFYRKCSGR